MATTYPPYLGDLTPPSTAHTPHQTKEGNHMIKLIIFDLNGTLITTRSGNKFMQNVEDWQWMPGRIDRLNQLARDGFTLAVATNQGGVAYGLLPQEALAQEISFMMKQAGIENYEICFHHPDGRVSGLQHDCPYRKPHPGMLQALMHRLGFLPTQTKLVGDRQEDIDAAHAAGVAFEDSRQFFAAEYDTDLRAQAQALRDAITLRCEGGTFMDALTDPGTAVYGLDVAIVRFLDEYQSEKGH